jgi:hypothetical protein
MLLLAAILALDIPPLPSADTTQARWLADLDPDRVQPGPGRFVFVPDSPVDEIDGHFEIEAAGWSPGLVRTVQFVKGETDEGLDVAEPIVVEGVLVVIRHPARGEFPAVVELQVREARRVRNGGRDGADFSGNRRSVLLRCPAFPSLGGRRVTTS